METIKGKFICSIADILPGASRSFEGPGGKPGILLNVEGMLKAFVNYCPHQGGETAPSVLPDGTPSLHCKLQWSFFDLITGVCLSGPPPEGSSLRQLALIVKDDKVYYE